MFSKISYPIRRCLSPSSQQIVSRSFADALKKGKTKEYVKVAVFLGVGFVTCYGTYKYASDIQVREYADEKIFIHTPWFLKKLNKWFPLDCYSPFTLQRISIPQEMKVVLADVFTDIDFTKEEGMNREDAIEFMKQIIQKDLPEQFASRLESGDYLYKFIKDFHYPSREVLPGLQKVMSIDEFVAFASDVLSYENISVEEFKKRSDQVLDEMHVKRESKEDSIADISGLNTNFVLPYIKEKYEIDDQVIEDYRSKKTAIEEKKKRREQLQEEKGILEYDLNQVYAEIADLKQSDYEDAKERIADLYLQINEIKQELKRVKNDLYYL